jgi:hypothetical protein
MAVKYIIGMISVWRILFSMYSIDSIDSFVHVLPCID